MANYYQTLNTSSDGQTWSQLPNSPWNPQTDTSQGGIAVVWMPTIATFFAAARTSPQFVKSIDGVNWNAVTTFPGLSSVNGAIWTGTYVVVYGSALGAANLGYYSSDLVTWTAIPAFPGSTSDGATRGINNMVWNGSALVANVSPNGTSSAWFQTYTIGSGWTQGSISGTGSIPYVQEFAINGSYILAACGNLGLMRSADGGATWAPISGYTSSGSSGNPNCNAIAWDGTRWRAGYFTINALGSSSSSLCMIGTTDATGLTGWANVTTPLDGNNSQDPIAVFTIRQSPLLWVVGLAQYSYVDGSGNSRNTMYSSDGSTFGVGTSPIDNPLGTGAVGPGPAAWSPTLGLWVSVLNGFTSAPPITSIGASFVTTVALSGSPIIPPFLRATPRTSRLSKVSTGP